MAVNPTITQLDSAQAFKRVYSGTNDSVRVELAAGVELAIELDAADGDNVYAIPNPLLISGALTTETTGTILAETACVGIKSVQIYSKTATTITTPPTLTVEVSFRDSGDFWFTTATTLVPSVTAGVVVASSIGTVVARRIRVVTSAATASGTADISLVGHSV